MARWYIIHAYSGFENKVKEAILSEAERTGLEAAGRSGGSAVGNHHRGEARQESADPSARPCPAMCWPSWR